jgi:hypothetical protein
MSLSSMRLDDVLVSSFYGCRVDSFPIARVWHPCCKLTRLFGDKTSFQNPVGLVLGYNTFLSLVPQKHHVGVIPSAKLDLSS